MVHRRARVVVAACGAVALLGTAACEQLLGVQGLADTGLPDSGNGAKEGGPGSKDGTMDGHPSHAEAGHDGGRDAGHDVEKPPVCEAGATQCSSSGLAVETCVDGGWSKQVACADAAPVCSGGVCSCAPGAVRCSGDDYQHFQTCSTPDDDTAPDWPDAAACVGETCTLAGCAAVPPSCAPHDAGVGTSPNGLGACPGPGGKSVSCCASYEIPAGSFFVNYDGTPTADQQAEIAVVDAFRLDRFEVTVGRFRQFVTALGAATAGWRPPPASGKHAYLNGGQGLEYPGAPAGAATQYEQGWDPAWNAQLSFLAGAANLSSNNPLECGNNGAYTWSFDGPDTPPQETSPINCVTWIEAYAFCIWDGGFLPSNSEWDYAAAGGASQNYYPWSKSPDDAGCSNAFFTPTVPCTTSPQAVGTAMGPGDSLWHQADLAGNVLEWTMDIDLGSAAPTTCDNCAILPPTDGAAPARVQRGGSYLSDRNAIRVAVPGSAVQSNRSTAAGFRCARPP